jgi:hypothetical protein
LLLYGTIIAQPFGIFILGLMKILASYIAMASTTIGEFTPPDSCPDIIDAIEPRVESWASSKMLSLRLLVH